MKCWNSAFNAQGSRVIIVVGLGRSNENICSNTEGALEKGKTGWNSSSHQNWWKNQFGSQLFCFIKYSFPVILFYKTFIPSCAFDALLCRNWPFLPPNWMTLQITLLVQIFRKLLSIVHKLITNLVYEAVVFMNINIKCCLLASLANQWNNADSQPFLHWLNFTQRSFFNIKLKLFWRDSNINPHNVVSQLFFHWLNFTESNF